MDTLTMPRRLTTWGLPSSSIPPAEYLTKTALPFALDETEQHQTTLNAPQSSFLVMDDTDTPSLSPESSGVNEISHHESCSQENHLEEHVVFDSQCIDAAASLLQGRSLLKDGSALWGSHAPLRWQNGGGWDRMTRLDEEPNTSLCTSTPSQPDSSFSSSIFQTPIIAPKSTPTGSATEQRLAVLAGARVVRTSDDSFQVTINVTPTLDVYDLLIDPMMLSEWNDAVSTVLLTRRDGGDQHEGVWVEATTGALLPPHNTSCWYHTARLVSKAMGFPSYGQVRMFQERQRAQLSLSIGPFPGGVELSHKITVVRHDDGSRVQIKDHVVIKYNKSMKLVAWSLPTIQDYMDQTVSSLARLRFLCEHGLDTSNANSDASSSDAPLLKFGAEIHHS